MSKIITPEEFVKIVREEIGKYQDIIAQIIMPHLGLHNESGQGSPIGVTGKSECVELPLAAVPGYNPGDSVTYGVEYLVTLDPGSFGQQEALQEAAKHPRGFIIYESGYFDERRMKTTLLFDLTREQVTKAALNATSKDRISHLKHTIGMPVDAGIQEFFDIIYMSRGTPKRDLTFE